MKEFKKELDGKKVILRFMESNGEGLLIAETVGKENRYHVLSRYDVEAKPTVKRVPRASKRKSNVDKDGAEIVDSL